ncbi:MAG: hypothetical protein ACXU8N_03030 [Telluria sp.]
MKVRRNLEGVFLVATAMTILATYASAMPVPHFNKRAPVSVVSASQPMATVVVTGHRLTAAEKAAAQ